MRRRGIRASHLVVIAASLALALFGLYYRAYVSKDGLLAQGGVMGLVCYLFGQLLLDAENELAIRAINYRINRLEGNPTGSDERDVWGRLN